MKEYSDPEEDSTYVPSEESRAAVRARSRLVGGLLATAGATVILQFALGQSLAVAVGISLFYVMLPAAAVAQSPLLPFVEVERIPMYRGSMVAILVVAALALLFSLPSPIGLGSLGLVLIPVPTMLLWTGLMFAAGIGIMAIFEPLDRRVGGEGAALVLSLIPRTDDERRAFAQLSIAAGVGEEIAYRGYAFAAVQALGLSPLAAAAVSAVPFAGLHAYQGPVGVARTGAIGLAFASSVLVTGSLLPAIAAHALVDVAAGLVIGPRLIARSESG